MKTYPKCAQCGRATWYCAKHGCKPRQDTLPACPACGIDLQPEFIRSAANSLAGKAKRPRAKGLVRNPKGRPAKVKTYPCTQCGGDATVGYGARKDSDWGGAVKINERLCTACFRARTGTAIF